MKIYYDNLTEQAVPIECTASFPEEHIELKSFKGEVYKAENLKDGGNYYVLTGDLVFEYSSICDRCATDAVITGNGNIQVYAIPEKETAADPAVLYQISDEEVDFYLTPPDHIDLDNILRQETYLLLPSKFVCENCEDFVDIVEEYDDVGISRSDFGEILEGFLKNKNNMEEE
jgi:uncharacterized metal-binding protein YceD (DUF177 family)